MRACVTRLIRNPYGVMFLFFVLYFLLPSTVISLTNESYGWQFDENSMILAETVAIFYSTLFFIIFLFTKPLDFSPVAWEVPKREMYFFLILSLTVLIILILEISTNYSQLSSKLINEGYTGKDGNDMSFLKTVAYFIMPIIAIFTAKENRYHWLNYTIVFLFCLIDLLSGTRTVGYIAVASIIFPKIITDTRVNLVIPFVVLIALYSFALMFRVDNSELIEVPFVVKHLGEFRETFNSFVYLIDRGFEPTYNFFTILEMSCIGLLGPLRGIIDQPVIPSVVIMDYIDKGYGFGMLFASEAYYYAGWLGVFIWPLILIAIIEVLKKYIFKNSLFGFIEYILFCILGRLFIREGVVVYIPFFLYMTLIYIILFFSTKLLFYKNAYKRHTSCP